MFSIILAWLSTQLWSHHQNQSLGSITPKSISVSLCITPVFFLGNHWPDFCTISWLTFLICIFLVMGTRISSCCLAVICKIAMASYASIFMWTFIHTYVRVGLGHTVGMCSASWDAAFQGSTILEGNCLDSLKYFLFYLFICVFILSVCLSPSLCTHERVWVYMHHHVGCRGRTQVIGLDGKCSLLQSHLLEPGPGLLQHRLEPQFLFLAASLCRLNAWVF